MPFTVSTRLGIKSARRWSTTSTCAQSDFTVSFFVTISFRRPTYIPPMPRAISTRTARTINAVFIFVLPDKLKTQSLRILHIELPVKLVSDRLDEYEIPVQ